jgi:REP element-mobilizing transposase RayT
VGFYPRLRTHGQFQLRIDRGYQNIAGYDEAMSRVHRLRNTDRIFFVSINLRRRVEPFRPLAYPLMIDALEGARGRLGFLLCGYVLMPDHWHALIGVSYPLTISQVIHDIKKVTARRLHERRGTEGPLWQHQFWDRFVRHAKEYGARMT